MAQLADLGSGRRRTAGPLLPIDLDPTIFPVGSLALTRIGDFDGRLWYLAAGIYELAVARSYADDLLHALRLAGAAVRA